MPITQSKQRISDFQFHVNSRARQIREAGDAAWENVKAKGEVEIVREFLAGKDCGTDYLNSSIAGLLGRNNRVVKFASIFLHQMPMVFGIKESPAGPPVTANKRCELGDLQTLFLYIDHDKNICQARSVIFQAKLKPHSGTHVIDHAQQRALYDECESFEYDTVLRGQSRRLPDGNLRERALQYIFVEEKPASVRTIPSTIGQGATASYGEHLLRFLNDSTGLEVPIDRNTKSDWGRVVWDMIDYVADELTTRGFIRNSGLRDILNHFNDFEDHETYVIDATDGKELPKEEGGFGLQLVIVWDSELGEQNMMAAEAPLGALPKDLLRLAELYENMQESNKPERWELLDSLSDEMADLIHEKGLSLDKISDAARRLRDEGLIAGLSRAIALRPRYLDIVSLIKVAEITVHDHVKELVLEAFHAFPADDSMSKSDREAVKAAAKEYLSTTSDVMAEKEDPLTSKMKQEHVDLFKELTDLTLDKSIVVNKPLRFNQGE